MLKLLMLAASALLLPASILAGTLIAAAARDLPPLQMDTRSDGVRPLVFGSYHGLA